MAISIKVIGGATGDFELKGVAHAFSRINVVGPTKCVDLFDIEKNPLYTIPVSQIRYVNHMDKTEDKDIHVRKAGGKIGIRINAGEKPDSVLIVENLAINWLFDEEHVYVYDKEGKILLYTIPLKYVRYIDYDYVDPKKSEKTSK